MTLSSFHGGVQLKRHKLLSTTTPIAQCPTPPELILPLQQHIGHIAKVIVNVGDTVFKGQLIARCEGNISAPIHAPTSGTISAIEQRPIAHPSGLSHKCIVLTTDGKDQWVSEHPKKDNPLGHSSQTLVKLIQRKGIVGLGGATFPTHVKLNPGQHTLLDTLIINAAECEPYITCDDMLLREHSDNILCGAIIMRHILGVKHIIIGIETDMVAAYNAISKALEASNHHDIVIERIPSIYPTGGEKQLIKVLTGREVPSGGFPSQIGVICQNVGTAFATYQAVVYDRPLLSRIVTVTGNNLEHGQNYEVLLGTPIDFLLQQHGNIKADSSFIAGGPMMGFELKQNTAPISKGINCILVNKQEKPPTPMPCIRCGKCAEVCPASLLPQQLYWFARAKELDKAEQHHLFDCIECGACAYICPSHIPLVQYYRFAKADIQLQAVEKEKADIARDRHEARIARTEKKKAEMEAKRRKKKEALKNSESSDDKAAKKAAIAEAMARVKAKKAQQEEAKTTNEPTNNSPKEPT
ncbi:MAG: electron transport complex subunit RsxC [Methylococcales bacterium]|jgi:Na+-translocating ferredoxin:NAD+ oxidoreductase subunit C|nr:electron transport complex subunit RsxC [Methylococcales bacterium]MBT7445185.1 electron transport complex subunit RsxC [Methylococcales bacterium]